MDPVLLSQIKLSRCSIHAINCCPLGCLCSHKVPRSQIPPVPASSFPHYCHLVYFNLRPLSRPHLPKSFLLLHRDYTTLLIRTVTMREVISINGKHFNPRRAAHRSIFSRSPYPNHLKKLTATVDSRPGWLPDCQFLLGGKH